MASTSQQKVSVSSEIEEKNLFDLEKVLRLLTESIKEDDILLSLYLEAYREINRFFEALGSVFSFVSSEINQKCDILENLIKTSTHNRDSDENPENNDVVPNGNVLYEMDPFESFGSMIDYEKTNDLLGKKDYVSGTRTLLRLHRGLDFIRDFLGRLVQLEPNMKVAECCQTAYNNTLAKFHPWIIRKGAVLAMYTMPTRQQLLLRVCETEANIDKTLYILPKMLEVTNDVYNRTQIMYAKHDLLMLD